LWAVADRIRACRFGDVGCFSGGGAWIRLLDGASSFSTTKGCGFFRRKKKLVKKIIAWVQLVILSSI
jgi:hypothetical protein